MKVPTIQVLIVADTVTGQSIVTGVQMDKAIEITNIINPRQAVSQLLSARRSEIILVSLYELLSSQTLNLKMQMSFEEALKDEPTIAILQAIAKNMPGAKTIILTPHSLPAEWLSALMWLGVRDVGFVDNSGELIRMIYRVYQQ